MIDSTQNTPPSPATVPMGVALGKLDTFVGVARSFAKAGEIRKAQELLDHVKWFTEANASQLDDMVGASGSRNPMLSGLAKQALKYRSGEYMLDFMSEGLLDPERNPTAGAAIARNFGTTPQQGEMFAKRRVTHGNPDTAAFATRALQQLASHLETSGAVAVSRQPPKPGEAPTPHTPVALSLNLFEQNFEGFAQRFGTSPDASRVYNESLQSAVAMEQASPGSGEASFDAIYSFFDGQENVTPDRVSWFRDQMVTAITPGKDGEPVVNPAVLDEVMSQMKGKVRLAGGASATPALRDKALFDGVLGAASLAETIASVQGLGTMRSANRVAAIGEALDLSFFPGDPNFDISVPVDPSGSPRPTNVADALQKRQWYAERHQELTAAGEALKAASAENAPFKKGNAAVQFLEARKAVVANGLPGMGKGAQDALLLSIDEQIQKVGTATDKAVSKAHGYAITEAQVSNMRIARGMGVDPLLAMRVMDFYDGPGSKPPTPDSTPAGARIDALPPAEIARAKADDAKAYATAARDSLVTTLRAKTEYGARLDNPLGSKGAVVERAAKEFEALTAAKGLKASPTPAMLAYWEANATRTRGFWAPPYVSKPGSAGDAAAWKDVLGLAKKRWNPAVSTEEMVTPSIDKQLADAGLTQEQVTRASEVLGLQDEHGKYLGNAASVVPTYVANLKAVNGISALERDQIYASIHQQGLEALRRLSRHTNTKPGQEAFKMVEELREARRKAEEATEKDKWQRQMDYRKQALDALKLAYGIEEEGGTTEGALTLVEGTTKRLEAVDKGPAPVAPADAAPAPRAKTWLEANW